MSALSLNNYLIIVSILVLVLIGLNGYLVKGLPVDSTYVRLHRVLVIAAMILALVFIDSRLVKRPVYLDGIARFGNNIVDLAGF